MRKDALTAGPPDAYFGGHCFRICIAPVRSFSFKRGPQRGFLHYVVLTMTPYTSSLVSPALMQALRQFGNRGGFLDYLYLFGTSCKTLGTVLFCAFSFLTRYIAFRRLRPGPFRPAQSFSGQFITIGGKLCGLVASDPNSYVTMDEETLNLHPRKQMGSWSGGWGGRLRGSTCVLVLFSRSPGAKLIL